MDINLRDDNSCISDNSYISDNRKNKLLILSNRLTKCKEGIINVFKTSGFIIGDVIEIRVNEVKTKLIIVVDITETNIYYMIYDSDRTISTACYTKTFILNRIISYRGHCNIDLFQG